jgi:tRNA A-37 threonylcarbamoyl transferase component Bud32
MKAFYKDVSNRKEKDIRREVELQERASKIGVSPKILDTNFKTYIRMENLDEMCIADMYGEDFDKMPKDIIDEIYNILMRLYLECDIEYIDVTPYNFIKKDDKLWIIDFGDARFVETNWFIKEVMINKKLVRWNPDFR